MSLGDLVISLNMNTATLASDAGKANQILESVGAKIINTSKQAEQQIARLQAASVTSVDRLQQSFNTLNIKSGLQIDQEAARIQAAFEKIRTSGVASMSEITRAEQAMKMQLESLNGGGIGNITAGLNLFSLASVAAIAKVQILYQLVNSVMSTLGKIPSAMMNSVESYNSSIVQNAATITSMQKGVTDIGAAYKENMKYATSVQEALIGMSSKTIASAEQLQNMNNVLVQQGIYLDTNNKKAVDGFTNLANAVGVIAKSSGNANQEFSVQVRELIEGVNRPNAQLLRTLTMIDPLLKEHLATWREQGTVLEHIGPMLAGYGAALPFIARLWSTVKTTMESITNQIMRDGFNNAFNGMVDKAQEFLVWLEKHKVAISDGINKGLLVTKGLLETITILAEGIGRALGSNSAMGKIVEGWGLLVAVILPVVAEKFGEMFKVLGDIAKMVGTIASGFVMFVGNMGAGIASIAKASFQALTGNSEAATKTLGDFVNKALGGSIKIFSKSLDDVFKNGSIDTDQLFDFSSFDKKMRDWDNKKSQATTTSKVPKPIGPPKPEDDPSKWNAMIEQFNKLLDDSNFDEYDKKVGEVTTRLIDFKAAFQSLTAEEQAQSNAQDKTFGGTIKAYQAMTKVILDNLHAKEMAKANPIIDMYNKAVGKSDESPLQRQLSDIQKMQENAKIAFTDASGPMREALAQAGIGIKEIDAAFANWSKRVTEDSERREALQNAINIAKQDELFTTSKLEELTHKQQMNEIGNQDVLQQKLALQKDLVDQLAGQLAIAQSIAKTEEDNKKINELTAGYNKAKKEVDVTYKPIYDTTAQGGFADAYKKFQETASNTGAQIASITTNMFNSMENALIKFCETGKLNFNKLAQSIIADLLKISIEKSMAGAMSGIGGMGIFAGLGSMFGGSTPAGAGAGFNGVLMSSMGADAFVLPSFDVGTPWVPQTGLALIHQGEAIIPAALNSPGATGVYSGGSLNGSNGITHNITIDARGADQGVEAKIQRGVQTAIEQSRAAVLQDFRRGGPTSKAAGSRA